MEYRRIEIPISETGDILIGQTEDVKAGTGCTVFISMEGMPAGIDIRGGGPAARESQLLDPLASAQKIHAVVLAGGSAYGLDAAGGVMKYLEEHNIGYDTGAALVPLVAQSDIYDLSVGDGSVRPDKEMGYEAARLALTAPNYKDGNYGAGCGATVGKIGGMDTCMKTGIGSYAIRTGELKIGAVVALNSLGDIFDWKTGEKIAGMLSEDKGSFRDTTEQMVRTGEYRENKFTGNTAVGIIITNAAFDKTALCRIASMAHDGYARSIRPVHTSADGDSIYAVSVGNVRADHDLAGILAAEVMSEAIKRAVSAAKSAYGYPAAEDIFTKDALTKAVIFDLDGTLTDTEIYYMKAMPEAVKKFGLEMTWDMALMLRSLGRPFAREQFKKWYGEDVPYDAIVAARKKIVAEMIAENGVPLKPGAKDLLKWLRTKGIITAVATANDRDKAKEKLEKAGILDLIDRVTGSDEVITGKPAPDLYIYACESLGLDPASTIAVEDSPNGIRSAYGAGCRTVMVPDQTGPDEEVKSMLYACADTLKDIKELVTGG